MYKKVDLNEAELNRLKQIIQYQKPRNWQELRPYYVTIWPVGSSGYALRENECLDQNNDERSSEEGCEELWLSDGMLALFWSYMIRSRKSAEFYDFLGFLISKGAYLWEFRNYWEYTYYDYEFRRASSKKVPKNVKSKLARLIGSQKNLEFYFSGDHYYAVKHPEYDFLVTIRGSIVLKKTRPVYMLLNAVDDNV